MSGQAEPMFAQVRRKAIRDLVNAQGFITVSELCARFGVSPATVRGDLRDLEQAGLLERTHGGAISSDKAVYEPDARQKEDRHVEEKQLIARAARAHIHPGDAIALDTGTTALQLAKLLGGIDKLTVATCDLQIAAWLESNTDVTVIMAGGLVRRHFHCTAGQTAIETLSRLHVDKVFVGANGVSAERGLTTPNLDMASLKSALVDCGDRVFLLADASKIGRTSFASFAPLQRVNTLITGRAADGDFCRQAEELGVTVEKV